MLETDDESHSRTNTFLDDNTEMEWRKEDEFKILEPKRHSSSLNDSLEYLK